MASLNVNIPHQLSREEALVRIKKLLEGLKEEQKDKISNVQEKWEDTSGQFSFTAMGFDLAGNIEVNDTSVVISSELPFMLSLFKGQIADLIAKKAQELLA